MLFKRSRSVQEIPGRLVLEHTEARRRLASTRLVGLLSTVELASFQRRTLVGEAGDFDVSLKYETNASR